MTSTSEARAVAAVSNERFKLGESPVWDDRDGMLYWADIEGEALHRLHAASGARQSWSFGEPVASLGLSQSGRLIVALTSDIVLFDPHNGHREVLASVMHTKPGMRFNDGKVGPDGAFWVGSGDGSGAGVPAGTLYRVSVERGAEAISGGLHFSNGLAWDLSGTRMYHSDSRGPWIDILDFDAVTGTATNRRRFRDLDETTGRPDGGACDAEGHYWSAGISAGCLNRFAPDGKLAEQIALPSLRPTMPCFAGPGLTTLYVTSLSTGVSDDLLARHPLCGAVVTLAAGVAGVPIHRFADRR